MISTLFQDKWIWLINKPSLIHSVVNNNSSNDSIAQFILSINPSSKKIAPKEGDAGLINRLDFETSGILMAAKSKEAWIAFQALLINGEIDKRYLIIVEGRLEKKVIIENWLGSRHRGSKKVSIYSKKPNSIKRLLHARSEFNPVAFDKYNDLTLVEVSASTARRHQVRVHASYLKHPLIGDKLYGSKKTLYGVYNELGGNGPMCPPFFLHSWKISFKHPFTNKKIVIKAPLPKDLLRLPIFKDFRD